MASAWGGSMDSHCIAMSASSRGWNFSRLTRPRASEGKALPRKAAGESREVAGAKVAKPIPGSRRSKGRNRVMALRLERELQAADGGLPPPREHRNPAPKSHRRSWFSDRHFSGLRTPLKAGLQPSASPCSKAASNGRGSRQETCPGQSTPGALWCRGADGKVSRRQENRPWRGGGGCQCSTGG